MNAALQAQPLRVGFTGYYGMRNFGDDLFGVLCAAGARRYWQAEPLLVGPEPADGELRATWPRALPSALYGASGALGGLSRWVGFVRGLRASDVLVLGGGSVINGRPSFRKPLMLAAQRRGRVRLAAVGVSIGPFANAAEQTAAADFARRFAYIAVRDRRSHALAQDMGLQDIVHAGRDLAGLLPLVAPTKERERNDNDPATIGIAPCRYTVRADHPAPTPQAWQDAIVQALVRIAPQRPIRACVFALNGHPQHGDAAIATQLQARLRERGIATELQIYRGGDPLATAAAIARCDAFVSARLHGAIVAYLQGLPFTLIDYHPKCRDFADDIGLPQALHIHAQHHDCAAFEAALSIMLNAGGTLADVSPNLYAQQALRIFQCAPWSSTALLPP
ncbi:polysaccharide pyruvyl transferase family protein [Lysobacter silvisoli]|uniref:Polysaccharide pyruvyl transferase domain-containing protein n=1 Tax=Lysobacter silvisoli TaxID=2293254 RepID=A0A371K0I1_9GAMM|nr:polysaccharide pyruvyl transferase family protein [Lysobacter silvisoli]RDZ27431.1 hypothetical protein DX914_14475 [Lysobacter silvisoli]